MATLAVYACLVLLLLTNGLEIVYTLRLARTIRRCGEMLKATERERAKGAEGIGPIAVPQRYHNPDTPTLADLGITMRESSDAQRLASLAQEVWLP